ncbi:hypothetical protein P5G50_04550 [Leifsonia sp. F6_8S_P_1B]|uniref:Uncharacterized protein n=1 Tax=Leifsonia williamsii TaxID=3035919 RepID=A0ABT8K8D4_9MICO|nr:hypothetical protein [Leifsonia williamsii]MDN4613716.1 hypothetical protein [Leifsonia williamsii]
MAALAVGGLACGLLSGFAPADAEAVNAAEAVAAIQQVAPEAVAAAIGGTNGADAAAAATAATEAGTVVVPADAAAGIRLGGETPGLTIGLPFAQRADDATASALPGVVVYDNNNGSSTVPVIRRNGSVQINTVIDRPTAPKRYLYAMALPVGASLRSTPGGGVESFGGAPDAAVLHVDAPWAKDARGGAVPTHYEVSGRSFTQVVDFTPRTAFPVTADPAIYIDRTTTQVINVVNRGVQTRWKFQLLHRGCANVVQRE